MHSFIHNARHLHLLNSTTQHSADVCHQQTTTAALHPSIDQQEAMTDAEDGKEEDIVEQQQQQQQEDNNSNGDGSPMDGKEEDIVEQQQQLPRSKPAEDGTAAAEADNQQNGQQQEDNNSNGNSGDGSPMDEVGVKKRRTVRQPSSDDDNNADAHQPTNAAGRSTPLLKHFTTDKDMARLAADGDRKYLDELEQELLALDVLCATSLMNTLSPSADGCSSSSNFVRQQQQQQWRHNLNYASDAGFKHLRELLVRELIKLRFRFTVERMAADGSSNPPKQQRQPPQHQQKTPTIQAINAPSTNASTTPKPIAWIQMTDKGLVQMSVKVPFPEPTLNNNGKYQNLIGRILGPRGISMRQLEIQYGCRILIRGQGSIKDIAKVKRLRGKPEGRHLEEKLHVLIETDGQSHEQCTRKLTAARRCIEQLMVPVFDDYKRQQLIQLAIINGTYRSRTRKDDNRNKQREMRVAAGPTNLRQMNG